MDDFSTRFRPELAEVVRRRANASQGFVPHVGLSVEEFGPGTVRCRLAYRAELDNNVGMVHGGALSALVDHTLSPAVYPLVDPGVWVATTNLTMQYLAPVRSGDCIAEGTSSRCASDRRWCGSRSRTKASSWPSPSGD